MGLGTNCLLMLTPARAGLAYLGPAKLQTGCSPSLARLSVGCWGHKSLDSLWCCEAQSQRLRGLKEKAGEGGTEEGRGIKSDSLLFTEKEENNVSSWVCVTSVPHSKKIYQQWSPVAKAHSSFLPCFLSPLGWQMIRNIWKLFVWNSALTGKTNCHTPHNSLCNFHTRNIALGENRKQGI